jgi:hypothetical protein
MHSVDGKSSEDMKIPDNQPDSPNCSYNQASLYRKQTAELGKLSQIETVETGTEEVKVKKQTRKKPAQRKTVKAEEEFVAPIGHNSAQRVEEVNQLEVLRDVVAGPLKDLTENRLKEFVVILEEREVDLNNREAILEQKILAVQSDLTEREQALNSRIKKVEAELSSREEALFEKIALVEQDLAQREAMIQERIVNTDRQIANLKSVTAQMDMDFTASLSIANKQHDRTIQDVGNAISSLGSQISQMGEQSSDAAE